jgi:NAD(P)-dependent dehydrogenase (short-subunit alcohol dehydrogenase family)
VTTPRSVLVTGAGGGFGQPAVARLAASGWRVFAADLTPPQPSDGVVPLTLDVTDDASVEAAVHEVREHTDYLHGVVHLAGILRVGSMAELPPEQFARVLDVNVLGVQRVTRAALPLLLEAQGRVVVVTSETAVQTPAPFVGAYAVSKHAADALADALRRELSHLGVAVVKLQPGAFRTALVEDTVAQFESAAASSAHFGPTLRGFAVLSRKGLSRLRDPAALAEVIEEALTARRPKTAYLVRPGRGRMLLERAPARVADGAYALGVRVFSAVGRRAR